MLAVLRAVPGPIAVKLYLLQYGVFECLRRAQANHGLGLDLDGFARLRVAAHARLAVRFHGAADIGDDVLSTPRHAGLAASKLP